MEISKGANSNHLTEDDLKARIKRLKEIDEALSSTLQVQGQIQNRFDNIDEFINHTIERSIITMKACADCMICEMHKKKENILKLLKSIDESIENDEKVVKIRNERNWYIKRVEDLEGRHRDYSQKISEKKERINELEEKIRDMKSTLKTVNVQNMKLQLKKDKTKRSSLPNSIQNSPKRRRPEAIGHSSRVISALVSPKNAIQNSKKNFKPDLIKSIKKSILETKAEIKKVQEENIKSNGYNMSKFFKSCYDTLHDDLIRKLPNKLSFIYKMLTENDIETPKHLRSLSYNGDYIPNIKSAGRVKQMKEEQLLNLKFTWPEFQKIDSHKVFILLSVKDNVLSELMKTISVNFPIKKHTERREKLNSMSEYELCKLRVRRNENGGILPL
ncbi:unnamed protein product [Blepharisma stoltei]|uniref:Uncharacterized protein n=1 Tax=Blepharisma stoltei TaxID=1481888 RepID=A0AAU9KDF9_9CILI|nr:unnamed protein product [Blepharisma stoltei]